MCTEEPFNQAVIGEEACEVAVTKGKLPVWMEKPPVTMYCCPAMVCVEPVLGVLEAYDMVDRDTSTRVTPAADHLRMLVRFVWVMYISALLLYPKYTSRLLSVNTYSQSEYTVQQTNRTTQKHKKTKQTRGLSISVPHLSQSDWDGDIIPRVTVASRVNINVVNVMLWMHRNAYEDSTIKKVAKLLRHLKRNCDTSDPEAVKQYIADKRCSNGHKQNLVEAYACFVNSLDLLWEQPFYQRYDKKRKPPPEALVDFLIDHARLEMALKLSMSKDLGQRPVELTWLQLKDIDLTTGLVSITGAKHTVGREGKLRAKSLDRLRIYIRKKKLTPNSRIYNGKSETLSSNYRHYRNRIADKYNMPELKQICLYDFRRFKGSREYHLTKNILHVKEILGHRDNSLRSTMRYVSLLSEDPSLWEPIIAVTDEEIKQCIRDDCVLVCQANGKTFFKKLKD